MFTVGPRSACAPFTLDWSARYLPIRVARLMSKVAPIAVPFGRHPEGIESKNRVPLTPFGPSDNLIEGIPSLLIGTVCQKSLPMKWLIFDLCLVRINWGFNLLTSCERNFLF